MVVTTPPPPRLIPAVRSPPVSMGSLTSLCFPAVSLFPRRRFVLCCSRDDDVGIPKLDQWDHMELKFGRLLGEDPKLTLAKVLARKEDPNASYLDVEKVFKKNKGKLGGTKYAIPDNFNVDIQQPSDSVNPRPNNSRINLSRPSGSVTPGLNLSRPVLNKPGRPVLQIQRPPVVEKPQVPENNNNKNEASTVSLRKPTTFQDDDIETDNYSNLRIKPNLFLKMRKDLDEDLSDVSLLKKPEVISKTSSPEKEDVSAAEPLSPSELLLKKPSIVISTDDKGASDDIGDSAAKVLIPEDGPGIGLRLPKKISVEPRDAEDTPDESSDFPVESVLIEKPQRITDTIVAEESRANGEETTRLNDESRKSDVVEQSISANQLEREDSDWTLAEHLFHAGERAEVDLVSCTGRGFVVSFGSLIGFLPYRNLGTKWKFLAFESWLRKRGLDPSLYRQNLSIVGSYEAPNKVLATESDRKDDENSTSNLKFEDLLKAYEEEKIRLLSSFVGQRLKVSVILADRNTRRLMFSGRPKEKEEVVEKKRSLMAKLSVGDVVKCCVKKITYFGIFVEVEGVNALIHQSEVSWDATLDPSTYFKIGEILEAKVHQLDYALERITLSLKEITPDPLMEALESVVGDHTSLGGNLDEAQADIEWADVESLMEELQQVDGVQSVEKGRFFLSPGLAPTFQVYMGSVFDNQYKLLARYGNKVQEVLVQSSLDKELMKTAISACTNRVK